MVEFLRGKANRPLRAKEIGRGLDVSQDDYRSFRRLLREMETDGLIVRQRRGRYALPEQFDLVAGRLQVTRKGDGFVIPDEPGADDVFVPGRLLATAVDGDRVLARIERRSPGRNPAGRIVRVVERAWSRIAGTYHPKKGYGFVVPMEPELGSDIFIPPDASGDAREGDVVVVSIRSWGDGNEPSPVGEVEQVLGRHGEAGVDVLAILIGHQLPLDFPAEVEREAEKVARRGIRPEDLSDREDLRDRLAFTIDPADARDHDDAVSVRDLGDGEVEVGVHIADVSWYVKPGSVLDGEAHERATSVYLVDRVVPMLPEELSAGLCSLVPDEDRLVLSVLFRMDGAGNVKESRPVRGVIRSRARLSYEEANRRLQAGGDDETSRALRTLAKVARGIRRRRTERGAIDFALPETVVELDDEGHPAAIRPRPRLETNRIIEDLMILTNETIAELGEAEDLPVLYRIHEPPSEDRLEALRRVAGVFDVPIAADRIRPADVAGLVERMTGRPQEYLVSTVALRSMKQARYSIRNVGHFGLGSEAYLHFTSPIRRYPDLVVHRAVVRWLADKPDRTDREQLERTARHASERERRAEAAERDSVELKKIEYMQRHLGDEFVGTISGVTGFGLFVLMDEVLVEGLVHISSLVDDYYHYDEDSWSLTGRRSKRRFQLGDRVEVQVARVDPESREIDLEMLGGPLDPGRDAG